MWAAYKSALIFNGIKQCNVCYKYDVQTKILKQSLQLAGRSSKNSYCNSKNQIFFQLRLYQTGAQFHGRDNSQTIGFMGWFLMLIPVTTFCLGTWQVKRREWKLQLIKELKSKTTAKPVELPEELSEVAKLEYCPVTVRGEFDHSKEMLLGPRSLLSHGDASSQGGLIAQGNQTGVLVITPFKLTDKNMTILVQRGWVPNNYKDAKARVAGQVQGEVEITGIVRLTEQRAPFVPHNKAGNTFWYYRDIDSMAHIASTEPIFIDAIAETSVPGGPIGGQTRVTLRNEHVSYILTWYGLSAATAFMWYRQFIQKLPLK